MGNEGSLPEGVAGLQDAEELEQQAKAPPSATPPPGMLPSTPGHSQSHYINGSGTAKGQHPLQQQQQLSERSGRKLMGSVFTRRGNAHNQNSTGIERAPPMEAAHSCPPSEYSSNGGGVISSSNNHNPSVVPMPGEELTYMNPAPLETGGYYSSPDSSHYQHHPPSPQQPIYVQQQQAASTPKQHVMPTQQYYSAQQQQIHPSVPQQPQEQHGDQVIGGAAASYQLPTQQIPATAPTPGTPNTVGSTKKARPAQRAGAALMNSMRNLSLGSAMQRATGMGGGGTVGGSASNSPARTAVSTAASRQQVNDWETRWDEDDDEEEEEVDDDAARRPPIPYRGEQAQQQHPQQQPLPLHPQMRPDMDSGFAAAAAAAANASSPQAGSVSAAATVLTGQLQQQGPSSYASPTPSHLQLQQQKAHLVTATPDAPAAHSMVDDDGVEWDTGIIQEQQHGLDGHPISDKPNVQQFLPLLRVLGKGSFGKVSMNSGGRCCAKGAFLPYENSYTCLCVLW